MKKIHYSLLLLYILFQSGQICAQNRNDSLWLSKVLDSAAKIKSGELEYISHVKHFNDQDTVRELIRLQFAHQQQGDSLIFHINSIDQKNRFWYEGKALYSFIKRSGRQLLVDSLPWVAVNSKVYFMLYQPVVNGFGYLENYLKKPGAVINISGDAQHNRVLNIFFRHVEDTNFRNLSITFYFHPGEYVPFHYRNQIETRWGETQYADFLTRYIRLNNLNAEDFCKGLEDSAKAYLAHYPLYQAPKAKLSQNLLDSGSIAPDWLCKDMEGKSVNLNALEGKLILLEFWYEGCYYCRMITPWFNKWQTEYGSRGLEIKALNSVGLNTDEVKAFAKKHDIGYPLLLHANEAAKEYGIVAYPSLYLLDENKQVLFRTEGYSEQAMQKIEKIIEAHLQ
jgi:thiol-disulfide isomerase/thioredoxin